MPLVEQSALVANLSPPLEKSLVVRLIEEFVSLERRYVLRDWEPAELDGGQFAEILARILYHADSENLDLTRGVDDSLKYIEADQNRHKMVPRHDALHIARVVRTIYKFRSQRGAVHISPHYKANHMDAKLIIEEVRWCLNDVIRLFWSGDKNEAARTVRELLEFDVPCIGKFGDTLMVQRTDLKAEEEILVLLHYAGEKGFTRSELGKFAKVSPASVTLALQKLSSPSLREIIAMADGTYRLTDLGSKRLRDRLADKLLLE